MTAYIICCNDGTEYVVLQDEAKAKAKMAELKEAYYRRQKWSFNSREEYNIRCYWHLHEVEYE